MTDFGERVRWAREARGYTLEELAETLGVSRQTISCYESGTKLPRADRLPALAAKLGKTIDWFFHTEPIEHASLAAETSIEEPYLARRLGELASGIEQLRQLVERLVNDQSLER